MSFLVKDVVVRGLWGVIAVPTMTPICNDPPPPRAMVQRVGGCVPPLPSARTAALLLGRGSRAVEAGLLCGWRSRMVQSRESPRMHTNHTRLCPGIPHITYCCYCMAAAVLRTWKVEEKGSPIGPCRHRLPAYLDRSPSFVVCRLTRRATAIADIHDD